MAVIQKYGKNHNPDLVCYKENHQPNKPSGAPAVSHKKWPEQSAHWSRPMARLWTVVLFFGTCLLYCARMTMPICAVSMAEQFHWSHKESGMVLGSFFWGYCFTQIFGDYVSDRCVRAMCPFWSQVPVGFWSFELEPGGMQSWGAR